MAADAVQIDLKHRAARREIERAVNRLRELERFYRDGDTDMADLMRLERQRLVRRLKLMQDIDGC